MASEVSVVIQDLSSHGILRNGQKMQHGQLIKLCSGDYVSFDTGNGASYRVRMDYNDIANHTSRTVKGRKMRESSSLRAGLCGEIPAIQSTFNSNILA